MHLLLMYFNSLKGPEVLYSVPDDLPKPIKKKMQKFFDIDIQNNFFEITILKENIKIISMVMEIPSMWARGHVETAMLSIIAEQELKSELFQDGLKNYTQKLLAVENLYKGFYLGEKSRNDPEIETKYKELTSLLSECYDHLQSVLNGNGNAQIVKNFQKFKW